MLEDLGLPSDEQAALIQEVLALRKNIEQSFNRVNLDIENLVARGGPFKSREFRNNVIALLELMRKELRLVDALDFLLVEICPREHMIDVDYYNRLN